MLFNGLKFRIVWRRRRVVRRKGKRKEYLAHKESARKLVHERLEYFNQFYGFKYNKISIRNQATRWGSCSRNGNLNFSYKLALLPSHLSDYIIVHELCHLKEFNHSTNFWNLVTQQIPNHKEIRRELKRSNSTSGSAENPHYSLSKLPKVYKSDNISK